jgi:hypothetical protein
MKPDRTNYEIWIVDYLDGNLNREQAEVLISFLEENPDIKEEFEGMTSFPVLSDTVTFGNKNSLHRTTGELSDSQFELLCAASLENDLSPEQKAELDEAISGNIERRKTFKLFSGTRLTPPELSYRYKRSLKKLTPAAKIFRFSFVGISAAAMVLIMFTLLRNPDVINSKIATGERQPVTDGRDKGNIETKKQTTINVPVKKEVIEVPVAGNLAEKNNEAVSAELKLLSNNNTMADTSLPEIDIQKSNIVRIGGKTEIPQENGSLNVSLVSMNITPVEPIDYETENAVGNFFTRLIREKILKSKTQEKGNLKAYEVADAGITGINKLFGSNMTLKKTIDNKGEVRSVYFNSKLLKFNAPVKKAEPME